MKNTKRSAFTIVELVIVIAVIAILSAVLIPTFGGIIKSANIASDQTTAATLTTELQIYLKGKQIKTEAELMHALDKVDNGGSGIGEKLTPKALSYGYHFWFDMETQTIFAYDYDEALAAREPYAGSEAGSIRNIHNNGFYLVDSDTALGEMFGDFAKIDSTNYDNYFTNLETDSKDYGELADKALENLKNTIIVNSNGVFFYTGEDKTSEVNSVWFAPGLELVKAKYYSYSGSGEATATTAGLPSVVGGEVILPSSVLLVEANALNFANATKVYINKTVGDAYAEIINLFAPKSTNATIVDSTGRQFNITVANGTSHKDGETVIDKDTDILVENDNFVAYLVPKASFDEWEIGYGLNLDEQKKDEAAYLYYGNTDEKLYVNIITDLDLFIKDGAGNKSYSVKKWESSEKSVIDDELNILSHGETTLTATVINLYGKEETKSINVAVNAAKQVNVTVESSPFNLGKDLVHNVNWHYSGNNPIDPVIDSISYHYNYAKGTEKLTVSIVETITDGVTDSMLALSANRTDVVRSNRESGKTLFTLSVDGVLTTTFDVNIIDNSESPLQVNFHDKSEDDIYYKYYIGEDNEIALGTLFGFKEGENVDLTGATVNIYDALDGNQVGQHINGLKSGLNATLGGEYDHTERIIEGISIMDYSHPWTLDSGWRDEYIEFTGFTSEASVWIQISPVNHPAIFIKFTLVDGTNVVYTEDGDKNDVTASEVNKYLADASVKGVVIHSDFVVNTGTTLNVGDKALYGNGYIITADKYTATSAAHTSTVDWCKQGNCAWSECDAWNHFMHSKENKPVAYEHFASDISLISLSSGTINNIYIDGPVYPKLQYLVNDCPVSGRSDAETAYYVSGIKVTGNATISNSYVSGFRQPIVVNGGSLSLNNSTLYGGSYANLQLVKGTLNLTDVTTIQPVDGIADDFGKNVRVVGLGIVVEKDAVTGTKSAITINGYLDQYNWVSSDAYKTISLPVVNISGATIRLDVVLAAMFNGMRITYGNEDINRKLAFLDNYLQTTTVNGKEVKYLNTGIMFMAFAPTSENVAKNASTNVAANLTVNDSARKDGELGNTKFTAQPLPLFSEYVPIESISFLSADKLMRALDSFTINQDTGVAEASFSLSMLSGLTNPIDVFLEVWTFNNQALNIFDGAYDMNYSGYYVNYGK